MYTAIITVNGRQGINSDRGLVYSSRYIYMYIMYMYLRAWVNQTVHLEREDLCKQKSQNVYILKLLYMYFEPVLKTTYMQTMHCSHGSIRMTVS